MADNKPKPPTIADALISAAQKNGENLRDKQSKPRFAGAEPIQPFNPAANTLLTALLGLQAGTQAGLQTSPLQSPAVSLLAGLGAGAKVPGALEDMRMQAIQGMPVEHVSPHLAQEFPELAGLPLSVVHQIAPLLKRHDDLRNQLILLGARGDQQMELLKARDGSRPNTDEYRLRSELRGLTKDFRTVRDSYRKIQSVANDPSAAGDLSLIFAYMKLLDPTSVVRESEQATAENARGVPDAVRNIYNKVLTGQKLPPDQRADFIRQAGNLYQSNLGTFNTTRQQYRDLAQRIGVNPDNIDIDFSAETGGAGKVRMKAPNGEIFEIPAANVEAAIKRGAKRL